jgi:nitrite reductase (NADH) small subunit
MNTMIQTLSKVKLTNYSSLPVKIGQVFQLGVEEIAVFRLTNGEVKAVENCSPHPKGGTLVDGLVSGYYVYCPNYDWKICLLDGQVQKPDYGKVKTYQVEIDGDTVSVLI